MNLVLLRPGERVGDDQARLVGRRARHLIEVLKVEKGRMLRLGIPDGGLGRAEVESLNPDSVSLRFRLEIEAPKPPSVDLLLAMPRPKVLGRILEQAAAIGVRRIVLVRTWHVEKSYMRSQRLEDAAIREHLLLGLEQSGVDTRVPSVTVEPLFRPFVEDRLDAWLGEGRRWLLDPAATERIGDRPIGAGSQALAVGPERGFTTFEVELLRSRGFLPCRLGRRILRVETACTLGLGRLAAEVELEAEPPQAGGASTRPS